MQRHALELLLTGFPMHNSQLTRPDMVKIANATIKVVLRRDMSLNRRLYAWLLGTDANGTPLQVYRNGYNFYKNVSLKLNSKVVIKLSLI